MMDFSDPEPVNQSQKAWVRAYLGRRLSADRQRSLLDATLESRPASDALAAWLKWHDARAYRHLPEGERLWLLPFERARVEALASRQLTGVAINLAKPPEQLAASQPMADFLLHGARLAFTGHSPRHDTAVRLRWRRYDRPRGLLARLVRARHGCEFHELPQFEALLDALEAAADQLDQPGPFAEALRPLLAGLARFRPEGPEPTGEQTAAIPQPEDADAAELVCLDDEAGDDDAQAEHIDPPIDQRYPDYRVFCRDHDECAPATRWLEPEDHAALEGLSAPERFHVRYLVRRLQRRLQAASLRHWQFDLEEGMIDNRRLGRLVTGTADRRVFRYRTESPVPRSFVSFLVDQSGSMRGHRQLMAAMSIDLLTHTLEICGIGCEVLGYTTRFRESNPVQESWTRAGCPAQPGRLNALRHIVFKSAHQPWMRARPSLGLMLRPDFGRENIDGESLDWAASRLASRPEERRILLVISDGAPYDEATVAQNGPGFLDRHLHSVVAQIEASGIHLVAIGAGANMIRFYGRSVTVHEPNTLPDMLCAELEALLLPGYPRGSSR